MGFTICSLTSTRLLYHIHIRVTRYHVTIKKYPPDSFPVGGKMLALPIFPGRRQPSIVGRDELNYRVRNGNGWTLALISTNFMSSGQPGKQAVLYTFYSLLSRGFYPQIANQCNVCDLVRKSSGGNQLSRLRGSV